MTNRLIVFSPGFRRKWQIYCSRSTLVLLLASLLTAFLAAIAVRHVMPRPVSDSEYSRLEAANRALEIECDNIKIKVTRLDADVARMEELSGRILAQLNSEDGD